MKMIIDFIKSWIYYPTLCKWFNDNNYGKFEDSRFQYAIKHYRMKKRLGEAKKNPPYWTSCYQQEPVKKRDKDMLEVDCRKCEYCTGHSCKKYGENANESVTRCANDNFKNYKPKRD